MALEDLGLKSLVKSALTVGVVAGATYFAAEKSSFTLNEPVKQESSQEKPKPSKLDPTKAKKEKSKREGRRVASSEKAQAPTLNTTRKSTRALRGSEESGTKSSSLAATSSVAPALSGGSYSASFDPVTPYRRPPPPPSFFEPRPFDFEEAFSASAGPQQGQCFGAGCSNSALDKNIDNTEPISSSYVVATPVDTPPAPSTSKAQIISVGSPKTPNGTYSAGDPDILIEILFTEKVSVLGIPRLTLETGGIDNEAVYSSGSGTDTLVFNYKIGNGDITSDLDYESVAALNLSGGAIQTLASNLPANLALPPPGAGGSLALVKDIVITDSISPIISSIESVQSGGRFGNTDKIDIRVYFDEVVNVVGGTPEIDIDSSATNVAMTGGSGSNVLEFLYTVAAGENSLDLAVTNFLSAGATITDASGNTAVLTLPPAGKRLEDTRNLIVDSVAPSIVSVSTPLSDGIYGIGSVIPIEVKFNEKVIKVAFPDVTTNTDIPVLVKYYGGNSTDTLTFNYTVGVGEDSADLDITAIGAGGGISDLVNNAANLATLKTGADPNSMMSLKNIVIDGTIPQVSSITPPANKTYHHGEAMDFAVNFSEVVNVTGVPRLKLNISGVVRYANYLTGSGTNSLTFRYTPQSPDVDSNGIAFSTTDIEFNSGTIKDNAKNTINTSFSGVVPVLTNVIVSSWNPGIVSDLKLWIDASDYSTMFTSNDCLTGEVNFPGVDIGCIKDKSGNDFHMTQVNIGTRPTLDKDATNGLRLELNSVENDFLHTQNPIGLNNNSNGRTVFLVAELKNTLNRAPLFAMGKNGDATSFLSVEANTFNSAGSLLGLYSNGNSFDSTVATSTNIFSMGFSSLSVQGDVTNEIIVMVNGNSSSYTKRFGVDSWGSAGVFSTYDNTAIGILPGNSIYTDAYIHEVVVYDKSLHPTELWFLNCYMGKKYNFLSSLPVGYCSTPPTPYVTKVQSQTANGNYETGTISIDVTFSEPVNVSGAVPYLTINTGSTTTSYNAPMVAGSGTNTLTFDYPIQPGDENSDLSYVNTSSLDNNFATITSVDSGANALLTLPTPGAAYSLSHSSAVVVDTNDPIDNTANVTPAQYDNDATDIPVTWTAFTDETLVDHKIELFKGDNTCSIAPTYFFHTLSGANNDNGAVDGVSDGVYWLKVTAIDALGHSKTSACSPSSLTVDTIAPTIKSINTAPAADGYYGLGQSLSITVTFSETVKVSGTPTITLDSGATVNYSSGAPGTTLTFNYTVGAGQNSLDLDVIAMTAGTYIRDLADNDADLTLPSFGGLDDSLLENRDIVIDTVAPTIAYVNRFPGIDGVFRLGENIDIQVVFNESVTVSGTPQITLNSGAPAVNMTSYLNETLTFNYVIGAGEATSDLDVTNITAGISITDLAGNTANLTLPAVGSPDDRLIEVRDIIINTTAPYVTDITSTLSDGTYYTGDYIPLILDYDQNVRVIGGVPYIDLNTTPQKRAVYRKHLPDNGEFYDPVTIAGSFSDSEVIDSADYNNDGSNDLALRSVSNNLVQILLGNGSGGFTQSDQLSLASARATVSGDFNQDGNVDLAIADDGSTTKLFYGRGDGTFTPPAALSGTGTFIESRFIDLNNDGLGDLITTNRSSNQVTVYIGDGQGNFSAGVNYSTPSNPTKFDLNDFNSDSHLDLILTNSSNNQVWLYIGNGDGTFNVGSSVVTHGGSLGSAITSGDYDNDGNQDIAVAEDNTATIKVFFGNGAASFSSGVNLTAYNSVSKMFTKDLNSDGNDDLIYGTNTASDYIATVISNGDRTFQAQNSVSIANGTSYYQMSDIDNDGLEDIIFSHSGTSSLYVVFAASSKMEFGYTIQKDDSSSDLNYSDAFSFFSNGATLQNAAALAADLLLPVESFSNSLGGNKNLVIDGSDHTSHRKILAPNITPTISDEFGGDGVAISGNYAVVASKLYDGKNKTDIGSVDFYQHDGNVWVFKQKILNPEGVAASEAFGSSLAIEGSKLLIGASGVNAGKGSVYYYEFDGNNWGYKQELDSSQVSLAAGQGNSLSLSGNWAVVGADSHEPGGNVGAGGAVVWKYNGVIWEEFQVIAATDNDAGDQFGYSVSISGNYLAVSAISDDAAGVNAGAFYIFEFSSNTWSQKHKFTPSATSGLGESISISGERLAVGSPADNSGKGVVHFYTFDGVNWVFVQTVASASGSTTEGFGTAVSLHGDIAIIGAPQDSNSSGTASGAVYVFQDDGSTWYERDKLIPRDSGNNRQYGSFVHTNGKDLIVAARRDSSVVSDGGSSYIHTLDITQASTVAGVTAPGTFYLGNPISFDIVFNDNITVVGGPLQLMLNNGGLATCLYQSPNALRCSFNVTLGEYTNDLDFLGFDSLLYNGASVTDSNGKDVSLNLPSLGSGNSLGDKTNYYLPAPPAEITNLTGYVIDDSQIYIQWGNGGGSTQGFHLAFSLGGSAPADCSSPNVSNYNSTSYIFTGLNPNQQYSFRVCSYNLNYTSAGQTVSFTTDKSIRMNRVSSWTDPKLNATVRKTLPLVNGKFYAVGNFSARFSAFAPKATVINSVGAMQTSFNPGVGFDGLYVMDTEPDPINTSRYYMAGNFSSFNGVNTTHLARVDINGGLDLSFDTRGKIDNYVWTVRPLEDETGRVYIGGEFANYNGIGRNRIARLNHDGTLDTSFNPGSGFNGTVRDIVLAPDGTGDIYVGGSFTTYNGVTVNRMVRLNADGSIDWSFNLGDSPATVGSNFNGNIGFDNNVTTIEPSLDGSFDIFVGGSFSNFKANPEGRIVKLEQDGDKRSSFNAGVGFDNTVYALETDPSDVTTLYVSGVFANYAGSAAARIIKLNFNGSKDTNFINNSGTTNSEIRSMLVKGSHLYLCGSFTQYRGSAMNRLAKVSKTTGTVDGTFLIGEGFGSDCYNAVNTGSHVLFSGAFGAYGGFYANKVARFNSNGSIDPTFNVGVGPDNGQVYDVALAPDDPNDIYLVGDFTTFNSGAVNATGIIRLNSNGTVDANTTFNTAAATGFDAPPFRVESATDGVHIYVAGAFTDFDGHTSEHLIKLNNSGNVPGGWDLPGSGFDGNVQDIKVADDGTQHIYVGGSFNNLGGVATGKIVRLDTNGARDSGFDAGLTTGFNGDVLTIDNTGTGNGDIYVGGIFTDYNSSGSNKNRIAKIQADGTYDSSFTTGSGFDSTVRQVRVSSDGSGDLYVAGDFNNYNANSDPIKSFARLQSNGSLKSGFYPGARSFSATIHSVMMARDGSDEVFVTGDYTDFNFQINQFFGRFEYTP